MALQRSDRGIPTWDWPVRIFHWTLVLLVVSQAVTASIGGNAMQYHVYGGYAILALVLFRVPWGFLGGTHALFRNFVRGPGAVMHYAKSLFRGPHVTHPGHNPLGGWSVLAMLGCLLLQAGTGLFADDDVTTRGPLAKHVSGRVSEIATAIHDVNAIMLPALIATHLAAVLFYLLARKQNLIAAMFTGRKHPPVCAEAARYGRPWLTAVLLGCSATLGLIKGDATLYSSPVVDSAHAPASPHRLRPGSPSHHPAG